MTPRAMRLPRWLACAPLLLALMACQTPPQPHADIVRGELAELVAAQQPACGAVRVHARQDRLHYRVECESGLVYRVRVRADGRVQVERHEGPAPAAP